jgi:uncharacterized protein YkwD
MQSCRALVIAMMLGAGCTDGVGTPIRLPLPVGDAAAPEPGGDAHERFDAQHCEETLEWPDGFEADERALLDAINQLRREGFRCGAERELDPMDALALSLSLRCSARLHSLDMVERDFTQRTNLEGEEPSERMRRAGYDVGDSNEIIVAGEAGEHDAMSALEDMLSEWDECNDLGSRRMTHVGIGRYEDRWTLDFAQPDDDDDRD